MKLRITPFEGTKARIFVVLQKLEQKAGMIILQQVEQTKRITGRVIAVGAMVDDKLPVAKVGDIVMFPDHAGFEFEFDGLTFLSMRESDVHGIITP